MTAQNNQTKIDYFLEKLSFLQQKFNNLEPELCETIIDPESGLEGYIVVWNTNIAKNSPIGRFGKGGTRIAPNLTLDTIKMLAQKMTLKNAAAGLPLGGAKSGIKADPHHLDLEKKYRRFADLSRPFLRENGGVFGGFGFDIGAHPDHAKWVCEELQSLNSFTGKSLSMGGTDYDRNGLAGLGVATAACALLQEKNISPLQTNFSVQGIGAMGTAVIRYFTKYGAHLKSISDPRLNGTWFLKQPASSDLIAALSVSDIQEILSLLKHMDTEHTTNSDAVLYQKVDILFPCAVQDVITQDNAHQIMARFIVEGANSPTTIDAQKILHDRNILVIPDIIANSGGIIAAYIELENGLSNTPVSIEENEREQILPRQAMNYTRDKISDNVTKLLSILNQQPGLRPDQAALYMALSAIFEEEFL